jgi:hypothetical protein
LENFDFVNRSVSRPLNAGEFPQRGNCYLVERVALRGVARVQRAPDYAQD